MEQSAHRAAKARLLFVGPKGLGKAGNLYGCGFIEARLPTLDWGLHGGAEWSGGKLGKGVTHWTLQVVVEDDGHSKRFWIGGGIK
jgi:hypothetical protein